jgi:flagellar FliJ protein
MAQKTFKFRLQSILDYKKDLEEKEKEKLAKILAEMAKAVSYRDFLKQRRAQSNQELKDKQRSGGVDVNQLRFYTNYLKKLDNDIIQVTLLIEKIKVLEREQRKALLEAAKERKKYEKVKEKHQEVFEAEMADAERKLIDELATIKFARKILEAREAEDDGPAREDWEEREATDTPREE